MARIHSTLFAISIQGKQAQEFRNEIEKFREK